MALSYRKLEYNTNVSYMGRVRQYLIYPDKVITRKKYYPLSEADKQSTFVMKREMRSQARNEMVDGEILPYSFTQALNLGQPPPRNLNLELFQFTDPWRTETSKYVISMW